MVLEFDQSSALWATEGDGEENGGAVGWSIANESRNFFESDWVSDTKSYYIRVNGTPSNNAPYFPAATLTRAVEENSAANENVGAVIPAATDDDSDTLTYSMEGTDAASFTFDTAARRIKTKSGVTYDHEAAPSYSVTIKVDDGRSGAGTVAVTINVTDANEPPSVPAAPAVSATAGSATSLDVSWMAPANTGKPAITSYDLQYRAGNSGNFTAGPQNVTGTRATIEDLEETTSYEVQVRATNDEGDRGWSGSGMGSTSTPNNAPDFSDDELTRSIQENTTVAGTDVGMAIPAAMDADGDTLTYSMEGTDAALFTFVAADLQIKTKAGVTYDFEAKPRYSVTIRVSDGKGSDTVAVTIDLTDKTEPPSAPDAPIVSANSRSATSLDVSWAAPANAGKPPITSYDLRYRVGNSGNFTDGPQNVTGTRATIEDLEETTSYEVQVRATNADGTSGWSGSGPGSTMPPGSMDPVPRAWIARFGRTVAEQVVGAVESQLAASRQPEVAVSLAGQTLPRRNADGTKAAAVRWKAEEAGDRVAALSHWLSGSGGDGQDGRRPGSGSRAVTERDLLTGTSFALTMETADGGTGALWGRGAIAGFDGREGALSLDGEVGTAMLGVPRPAAP